VFHISVVTNSKFRLNFLVLFLCGQNLKAMHHGRDTMVAGTTVLCLSLVAGNKVDRVSH